MDTPITYKCSGCQTLRPASEFAPSIAASIAAHKAGGYCRGCIKLRYAELGDDATVHTCGDCKQARPVSDFFPSNVAKRTWGKCRECRRVQYQANRSNEQARYRKRASNKKFWDRHANGELARRYGMSLADYESLLARQNGHCACCGVEDIGRRLSKRLHVDHDHETGKIRGLLCHKCNIGIGAMGDTAAGVRRALTYLEKPDTAGVGAGLLF